MEQAKLDQQKKNRVSLRTQTLIVFVAVLAVLGIIFLFSSFFIRRGAEDDYRVGTSETAVNNVISTIDSTVENYNYISRLIMVNERVVSFLHANEANKSMSYEARMGMYEILNMYNDISYIESVYIFRNDMQYANTGKSEYLIDLESPEWQRIVEAHGGKVLSISGNGMMVKPDGKPVLTFARAIYDLYSQKLLGYLVMNISSSSLEGVLALQKSSEMCIMDKNGVVLCGNQEVAELYDRAYADAETIQKMIKGRGKREAFMCKQGADPFLVLCCTGSGANTVPVQTFGALIILFVVAFAATLLCAWFIRSEVTQPILSLDEAMEATQSSGWMKQIDAKMPDNEIGHLAESYNHMIDYLNELFERLKKEEESIRKAEMRVLQEQIKPHFLYNTLGTISYIAVEEHAERAHDALETLGSFYRNFLSKGDREIPFRRELGITKDYLSLQKLRYGASFEDEYDIDEKALDYMVPKLILQPLVENCIYHGVRLKGELCVIQITARVKEDGLHVLVYDSGVGMSREQIDQVLAKDRSEAAQEDWQKKGFGLAGTIDRIRYFCNNMDVVSIRSEEGEYTEIEIHIPGDAVSAQSQNAGM